MRLSCQESCIFILLIKSNKRPFLCETAPDTGQRIYPTLQADLKNAFKV